MAVYEKDINSYVQFLEMASTEIRALKNFCTVSFASFAEINVNGMGIKKTEVGKKVVFQVILQKDIKIYTTIDRNLFSSENVDR